MASLFHFIFELIKISILGWIYSTILYFIFKEIPAKKKPEWCKKIFKTKKSIWIFTCLLLLFYMFTPYGNHGLGDSARIPISFSKAVSNVDWTEESTIDDVETKDRSNLQAKEFKIIDEIVCGKYNNFHFIYNSDKDKLEEFYTENEYNENAKLLDLPLSDELLSFKENYDEYWHNWRLFLLP
ncbi:hypothetical protein [Flavobacterium algicola]|uniref:hypothetical protein n=1 Tax=Flavobacterium algicola TaxID=556529 RepID=UPI001EFE0045|nr:hypothetical protein [Flavobacterium algicola]MCG9792639.1 hypothetical protein [Flavobacterium algicola]